MGARGGSQGVKLETFFEKFDQFADAPDAVAKMRELVLDLAVQGRLVPQHAREGTALGLLERVATTAKSRRRDPGESEDTDAPFPIPVSWVWVRLPRVLKKLTDGTHHSPPNGPSGAIMYVTAKNIKTGGVLLDGITYVSKEVHDEIYSRCDPSFGDVLYIKDGATTGIATINQVKEPFSMLSSVALLKPSEAIFNRYLLWAMRSPFFYAETRGAMKGAAITRVTLAVLAASLLPLPPLAEQKRIVAKVDELMALCDRLEAQQQERETRHAALARASLSRFADATTPANLHFLFHPSYAISPADLRKSILTLAVQGKLVPQDPNEEGARAMIDRAMEKRNQTIKSKSLRRKKIDESAEIFEQADLPLSWCVERFANLVDPENTISYGVLVPGNDVPDGIPFVRAQDLCLANHPPRPNKTIAPEIERPYARTRLTGGEILLCVVGSIGKLGVVPDSWAGANIARAVARIKPIPDVLRDYLVLVLQEKSVQSYFTSTTRTLAQPTLNVSMIEQTPIPVPPLAEQRRIVAKVEQLMALVDALESQLAASRATAEKLLAAVVAELTEGTRASPAC